MIGLFFLWQPTIAAQVPDRVIPEISSPVAEEDGPRQIPAFRRLDSSVEALMIKWNLPGGAIAITSDERLVYARGYGVADKISGKPVRPDSLFRIGSVSKPITAVAILKLMDEGKLDLDAKAFRILEQLHPAETTQVDPRIYEVSVRQLLNHSGGWDSQVSSDPLGQFREAAAALHLTLPVDAGGIIRFMLGRPLDYAPGSRHAYSNFGYCVLGRVIERQSGLSYERYTLEHVLKPVGIRDMRIGRTLDGDRYPGEVRYYPATGVHPVLSALSAEEKLVPLPYGGYYLESMDSNGGWIASVIDLARFLTAVDGRDGRPDLLSPVTRELMLARPQPPLWVGTQTYYGLGWNVRPLKKGPLFYHTGALAGTSLATVVCMPAGQSWAALFNSMPAKPSDLNPFFAELDEVVGRAMAGVTEWPTDDLFRKYDQ